MQVEADEMRVLVVYASRYGATQGIAERIAEVINRNGHLAEAVPVAAAGRLDGYNAYVVGSAVYEFSWLRPARTFVKDNAATLATRPVWLFSSGPIGTNTVDDQGRDVRESSAPKDVAELTALVHARGHRVFFGAFNQANLNFVDRLICSLPALKALMREGDFRDWDDIEAWATSIAGALAPVAAG
jgi:menaquinone-dependent protoporphyrinogen oxidase